MATYKNAQRRAHAGRLREAKDLMMKCASASCGSFLLHACTSRYTQLDADIPSVVPLVADGSGQPLADVQVVMDGQLLTDKLDGHALPVDPGRHEFSFIVRGENIDTQTLLIATGQRNRPLSTALPATGEASHRKSTVAAAAPPPAPEPSPKAAPPLPDEEDEEPSADAPEKSAAADEDEHPAPRRRAKKHVAESSGTSAFAYVFGVTGLAGLGGAALLTYWGRKDNQMLAGCSPNCLPASVQHVHRLYQGADVSLGVGVASLLISTWIFIASGSSSEKPGREEAMRFNVHAGPTGTFATMAGTF
ncbi:MAG TPA: hypothetical protein VNO55_13045 [Polyangia bacterium]|nr:hypothetical protein [Polyangia bacterium]